MNPQGMAVMVISKDESANKVVVCAGVPEKSDQYKDFNVKEWLTAVLDPLNGKGGGKGCLVQGQVRALCWLNDFFFFLVRSYSIPFLCD